MSLFRVNSLSGFPQRGDRTTNFLSPFTFLNRLTGHSESRPRGSVRSLQTLLASLCIFVLALTVSGCGPKAAKPTQKADGEREGAAKDNEKGKKDNTPDETSDDVLASAIYQLRPENYGIHSATDKPINLLNSWRIKQEDAEKKQAGGRDKDVHPKTDESDSAMAPAGWIAKDDAPRLSQTKYDAVDAVHIRDAMFHHAISGYLSDRSREELQRVGIVVDFVCRNVALWKVDEIELPLVPYLILQLGRGTAEDRAWICGEILRQLRIDSMILRSKADTKGNSDKWLLGVLIEKQVYLYDTRLGLPIYNGSDDAGFAAASLADVVSHPEWLERMAASAPYPLTVDDLKDPAVFVMSSPNFWCRRMHKLEQVLPARDQCVLYDPLSDEDGRTGVLKRISSGGNWPIETLKLWPYPRQQLEESKNSTDERTQEWQRLTVVFSVPIPVSFDESGKPKVGTPERKMQRFRSDQLLGKFSEATTKYLRIRHLEVERNPPDLERLNRMASEDAFFWTGLCKFELCEYETAVELFSDYVKKYDRKGKWFFQARSLLAQCYANQGKYQEAISTMERTSSDDPYRDANAVRVKSWSALKSKPAKN